MSIKQTNSFIDMDGLIKPVSTKNYNGSIMCKDIKIAEVVDNSVLIINNSVIPFYLLRGASFESWLETRAIDNNRNNSRVLKKVLGLGANMNDMDTVLYSHAATITDSYWFKPTNSVLTYEDVLFKSDKLSDIALNGLVEDLSLNFEGEVTPELTNVGSYEKCWKLVNNKWFLNKKCTNEEKFSEYFTYKLGKFLGFNMAEYSVDKYKPKVISSKDFTDSAQVNYEPMYCLVDEVEDYIYNFEVLLGLERTYNCNLVEDYLNIIFLDTLIQNSDRHTFNYGILRKVISDGNSDSFNNVVVGMAPNFDNNLSLLSPHIPRSRMSSKTLIGLFLKVLKHFNYSYNIPELTGGDVINLIEECISETGCVVDEEFIIDFVYNTYEYLVNEIKALEI